MYNIRLNQIGQIIQKRGVVYSIAKLLGTDWLILTIHNTQS